MEFNNQEQMICFMVIKSSGVLIKGEKETKTCTSGKSRTVNRLLTTTINSTVPNITISRTLINRTLTKVTISAVKFWCHHQTSFCVL